MKEFLSFGRFWGPACECMAPRRILDEWLRNRRKKFKHIVSVFHACVILRKAWQTRNELNCSFNTTQKSSQLKHQRVQDRMVGKKTSYHTAGGRGFNSFDGGTLSQKKEKVNWIGADAWKKGFWYLICWWNWWSILFFDVFCWWNDKTSTGWYSTPHLVQSRFPGSFSQQASNTLVRVMTFMWVLCGWVLVMSFVMPQVGGSLDVWNPLSMSRPIYFRGP